MNKFNKNNDNYLQIFKNNNNKRSKTPDLNLAHDKIYCNKIKKIIKTIEDKQNEENINLTFKPKINTYSKKLVDNKKDKLINVVNKYNKQLLLLQNEQKKIFTYRPKINKVSKNISKIKRIKREKSLLNDKSLINPKDLKDSTNQLNKKQMNSDEKDLNNNNNKKKEKLKKSLDNPINSFKNQNNIISEDKKNLFQLAPKKNLYDYLYLEYKLLKQKRKKQIKENMILNYPFKPKLNKTYNCHIKNSENNVYNRLYTIKNDDILKDIRKIRLYRRFNTNINNELNNFLTNKINYKSILKKQSNNIHQKSISEDINKKFMSYLGENIKSDKINNYKFKNSNKKKYLQKSNNIILKAKNIKYKELFNILDSDRDGFISYKKVRLSELNFEELKYLTPILNELQYKGIKMDLNMFAERIQNIP